MEVILKMGKKCLFGNAVILNLVLNSHSISDVNGVLPPVSSNIPQSLTFKKYHRKFCFLQLEAQ